MNSNMFIQNHIFSNLLKDADELKEFVSILEIIRKLSYKVTIKNDDYISEIYEIIRYDFKKNEDIRIINKLLEKNFNFLEIIDYDKKILDIQNVAANESSCFKSILVLNESFNFNFRDIAYKVGEELKVRNVSSVDCLSQVLIASCQRLNNPSDFAREITIILHDIIFDEDIVDSIDRLNDGFNLRKQEILYHLYCIYKEIPEILNRGYQGYKDIGLQMTINCSPERNRQTVRNKLSLKINGIDVNCELHTKMDVISSKSPDRVYFCPALPVECGDEVGGKTFIYKITAHA